MRKIILTITIWLSFSLFVNCFVFSDINKMDDLKRSLKDLERSIKQDPIKDVELQKDYQLPQQNLRLKIQDITPQDLPTTDKAVLRNQERFKKMMDAKKKKLSDNIEGGFKLPEQYRFIIELFVIGLFISFFGILFYRKKLKYLEGKKPAEVDEVLGDDITFYKPEPPKKE